MKPSSSGMMVWSCVLGSRNAGKRMDLLGPFWPFGGFGSGHPGDSWTIKHSSHFDGTQVGRCRAPRGALNSLQDRGELGKDSVGYLSEGAENVSSSCPVDPNLKGLPALFEAQVEPS